MEQLLREGAYAVLMEDNEDDVKAFCEQDIDSILDQRAHKVVTDTGKEQKGTASWLNKKRKARSVNRSVFTGNDSAAHAEVDVNDPEFWKKVLPDLVRVWLRVTFYLILCSSVCVCSVTLYFCVLFLVLFLW